jgi:RHS repeat-associated protein
VTVVSTFGVLDRLESETYPEPVLRVAYPYPLSTSYLYDGNGNVEQVTERKRTSATATVDEVKDPTYDVLGRLESEERYDGKVVQYGYDAKGNRTSVTDPDEVATSYTYDAQDRLETATTPAGQATYRYWPDGLVKGVSLPNGVEEARCYDPAGRLTAIVTARGAIAGTCASPGEMVSRFDYEHDVNGNRLRQLERRTDPASQLLGSTEETRYGYDPQDRLIGVAYPDDTAVLYQLDPVGNRTGERRALASRVAALTVAAFAALAPADTLADVTGTFNRADWLVSQVDARDASRNVTNGYDLTGNLTEKVKSSSHRDLRWSYRNTLTAVLQGSSASDLAEIGRYDYDADLQRVKRTTAAEQVEYVLDERHVLQEASAAAGHPSYRRYHYADGPLAVADTAGNRLISTDALGSPTDLTAAAGTIASMRKYDAWGQYRNDTAPGATEPKLGFTGHQYDPETGLVYARARYYDAELGRFVSRDSHEGTLADAPSLHRYAYVRGNPLIHVDPSGHLTLAPPPNQDLIKQEMEIRWQQYQTAESPEAKAQALEKYRYWQGQLSERQDNDIFAEEVTTPMAVAAWSSAVAGPVAAEFTAVKAALAGVGVVEGSSEIREGAKQGGQLGVARVVAGAATVLASAAAVLPEGIQAVKWLRGKLTGEKPSVTTVVESGATPGTAPVPEPAVASPGPRSLGGAAANDPALVVGEVEGAVGKNAAALANPIPARMARAIPAEFAGGARLGARGANEAWVTAAEDLAGISTSEGLAQRLTLVDSTGASIPGPRAVIEFDAVTEGLASPVFRDAPGFVGGGRTAGGAREFVLPNLQIDQLRNVTVRIVP